MTETNMRLRRRVMRKTR